MKLDFTLLKEYFTMFVHENYHSKEADLVKSFNDIVLAYNNFDVKDKERLNNFVKHELGECKIPKTCESIILKFLNFEPPTKLLKFMAVNNEDICSICHDPLNDLNDDTKTCAHSDKHKFHKHCIDEWVKINPKCPLCNSLNFDGSRPVEPRPVEPRPIPAVRNVLRRNQASFRYWAILWTLFMHWFMGIANREDNIIKNIIHYIMNFMGILLILMSNAEWIVYGGIDQANEAFGNLHFKKSVNKSGKKSGKKSVKKSGKKSVKKYI